MATSSGSLNPPVLLIDRQATSGLITDKERSMIESDGCVPEPEPQRERNGKLAHIIMPFL